MIHVASFSRLEPRRVRRSIWIALTRWYSAAHRRGGILTGQAGRAKQLQSLPSVSYQNNMPPSRASHRI